MRSRLSTLATAVALVLGTSAASASVVDDMFSIRGYGTVGALYSGEDNADYVHDFYSQKEGVGRSHSATAAMDSRTAVQLDAKFTDRFSGVVQLVSEALYNNSWDNDPNKLWTPSLEWANLSYRVTDSLTVRGGRIVLPFLMTAEYQKVGYANHWMRTPNELYGKIPYSSVDGGDVSFKHALGSGINTMRAYYGTQEFRAEAPLGKSDGTMYGFVDTYELGALTLRASYLNLGIENLHVDTARVGMLQSVAGMFAAGGAANAATAVGQFISAASGDKIKDNNYFALGAAYDAGKWFATSELLKNTGVKVARDYTSGYLSGGVRIDKWTPYATISATDVKGFEAFVPTAGLSGMLLAVANGVNGSLKDLDAPVNQKTLSLGVRWDVVGNLAVKAQYDYIMLPKDSVGMLINVNDNFEPGTDVSLFGLSVDFVF